ncbi:MMPL family transporter [Halosegnis longus]|uniref:Protein-export membrane protein SecD n=1 Tax=Halosegnis longus TaxID=2216012 RepID=A0AAJ4UWJ2_9EURY|nr:preprotein translocase subunit SecD [Salella cibi]
MIRENWRLVLLVVLVFGGTLALFGPLGAATGDGPTNLQYGLELSGGASVRAPLVGMTADPVDLQGTSGQDLERDIAAELGVSPPTVEVRYPDADQATTEGTVEVYNETITEAEFAAALSAAGLDADESVIEPGLTRETYDTAERVLDSKINAGGLTGGDASVTSSDPPYLIVEVPNANRSQVLELVGEPGRVQVVGLHPGENGSYERVPLFDQETLNVNGVSQDRSGQWGVDVSVANEETARRFANIMQQEGYTNNQGQCNYEVGSGPQGDNAYCLLTVRDGEVVDAVSMGPLADTIESGGFVDDPRFFISTTSQEDARELEINLRAGALPSALDVESGTTYFLQPSLAQDFKFLSLVTGVVAVLAVSLTVFIRYREPGVALPMILTAGAEVYLLLGFSALIGLALDLSHIAGFIAVIGTGVDDLIIIADEILQGERVSTGRVFESRFRKAFWVIGAAAATTIIAMSPLAVLSLGDLQGFAIVTIVGVLLGVLVTRPAYGNILRNIVLD